jgi:hypothetical protein
MTQVYSIAPTRRRSWSIVAAPWWTTSQRRVITRPVSYDPSPWRAASKIGEAASYTSTTISVKSFSLSPSLSCSANRIKVHARGWVTHSVGIRGDAASSSRLPVTRIGPSVIYMRGTPAKMVRQEWGRTDLAIPWSSEK